MSEHPTDPQHERVTLSELQQHYPRVPGYLSACTAGLPAEATTAALRAFVDEWSAGSLDPKRIGAQLEACRALYGRLVGVATDRVAIGSQASQLASVVATAVPDDGEVLCVVGDFASLTHPFEQLRARGVRVRYAELEHLAAAIDARTSLVAWSHVQSATGAVSDAAAIAAAARSVGALTCVDLTQAVGWLPVDASSFDVTICHAYKWLCAPRGSAFMTVRDGLDDALTPLAAGWYSADDPWSSCYAGRTPLAAGAGRFDLSPAWPVVAGTVAALETISRIDLRVVHDHAAGLANSARSVLGLAPGDSAIVTWPDRDGSDLAAMTEAGITASGRAGNARVAFHLWNTPDDVARLQSALGASAG
ncbi:aminotransferase class V-fold PLP-dependent enzyme [Leucobacter chromiiresistens]|uniref:Selenocysteine lyase/Cysteine desulfurase n=1 Tax=Leucobacter chromiiresistens TaxID=1079994 RepID=A0A1H0ZLR5_9MICO|nr:aminotransferase class V-fold PLP-dependent enzyme [Leucobacter chromiiresistens]SDQ28312.1 Selenocysteine lyase/Cysteine desulfurase [Leucobacter chromiiresistens]